MEVREFTSVQKPAIEAPARPQTDRKSSTTKGNEVSSAPAQQADKVELSTVSAKAIVEKSGVAPAKEQTERVARPQKEAAQAQSTEKVDNTPLRRDYAVENGDLVVKFVDTKAHQVVKEIPGEESRRIKEAIAKFRENEPNNQQAADNSSNGDAAVNKAIDVTS